MPYNVDIARQMAGGAALIQGAFESFEETRRILQDRQDRQDAKGVEAEMREKLQAVRAGAQDMQTELEELQDRHAESGVSLEEASAAQAKAELAAQRSLTQQYDLLADYRSRYGANKYIVKTVDGEMKMVTDRVGLAMKAYEAHTKMQQAELDATRSEMSRARGARQEEELGIKREEAESKQETRGRRTEIAESREARETEAHEEKMREAPLERRRKEAEAGRAEAREARESKRAHQDEILDVQKRIGDFETRIAGEEEWQEKQFTAGARISPVRKNRLRWLRDKVRELEGREDELMRAEREMPEEAVLAEEELSEGTPEGTEAEAAIETSSAFSPEAVEGAKLLKKETGQPVWQGE